MKKTGFYFNRLTLFSLSAVLFFGPLLKRQLGDFSFSQEEQSILNQYIRIGTFATLLLVFVVLLFFLSSFFPFNGVYLQRGLYLLVIVEIYGIISVFTNSVPESYSGSLSQKMKILSSFIPGYGSYKWYALARYQHPIWWFKESELFRGIAILFFLISFKLGVVFLLLLVLRLFFFLLGIDLIDHVLKEKLNKLFTVNVEELFAYFFAFSFPFRKKRTLEFRDYINYLKGAYRQALSFGNLRVVLGLIILVILFAVGGYFSWNLLGLGCAGALIITRYLIQIIILKKIVPRLPMFVERG